MMPKHSAYWSFNHCEFINFHLLYSSRRKSFCPWLSNKKKNRALILILITDYWPILRPAAYTVSFLNLKSINLTVWNWLLYSNMCNITWGCNYTTVCGLSDMKIGLTLVNWFDAKHQKPSLPLKVDLMKQNWNEVYVNDDPNKTYEPFLSTLITLYEKNCPLRKFPRKHTYVDKPWII